MIYFKTIESRLKILDSMIVKFTFSVKCFGFEVKFIIF